MQQRPWLSFIRIQSARSLIQFSNDVLTSLCKCLKLHNLQVQTFQCLFWCVWHVILCSVFLFCLFQSIQQENFVIYKRTANCCEIFLYLSDISSTITFLAPAHSSFSCSHIPLSSAATCHLHICVTIPYTFHGFKSPRFDICGIKLDPIASIWVGLLELLHCWCLQTKILHHI